MPIKAQVVKSGDDDDGDGYSGHGDGYGGYGGYGDGGGGDGDGGGYGDGGYGGDGVGGGGYGYSGDGGDGGDGYGGGGYGGGCDGYSGDGGGDGDGGSLEANNPKGDSMREGKNGLGIVVVQGTSYPYVMVGWVTKSGDEVTIDGARVLRRFGANQFLAGLATSGPAEDTQIGPPASEDVHRLLVHRLIRADEKAWSKECPRPKGWVDDQ